MYKSGLKKIVLAAVLTTGALVNSGCSNQLPDKDPNHIKVGVSAGLEYQVAQVASKVAKEKFNLEVELITFSDFVVPNESLNQGDLDLNAFQHKPYLDEQSKQRGYNLVAVGKTFVYPIAAYSKKIKNIEELPDGVTVAIPNDPTNGGRALLLLQKAGLIILKESVGLLPRLTDIVSNSKRLNILELEAPQLPRVLDDNQVFLAIINNTFAAQIGLTPNEDGLLLEDKDSPYVNLIVARQDNKDSEKVKNFVKAYQSVEVENTAERIFKGSAIKGW